MILLVDHIICVIYDKLPKIQFVTTYMKVINEKLLNKSKEIHYLAENCEGSNMANFIIVF